MSMRLVGGGSYVSEDPKGGWKMEMEMEWLYCDNIFSL